MNSSPTIAKLSESLVKAQSKMGGAVKGSSNPYFKSKYSDLNSVIEACKEHLNSEGISVIQPVVSDEHGDYVETILIHTSGEFISSRMRLRTQKENDMQAYGSSISYARRYGLQSMVFIPSSEDDDGESTMGRKQVEKKTQSISVPYTLPTVTLVSSQGPVTSATTIVSDPIITSASPPMSVTVPTTSKSSFRAKKTPPVVIPATSDGF